MARQRNPKSLSRSIPSLYFAPPDKPPIAWGLEGAELERAICKTFGKSLELAPATSLELLEQNPFGLAIPGRRALLALLIFFNLGGSLSSGFAQLFERGVARLPSGVDRARLIQNLLETLLFSDGASLRYLVPYAGVDALGAVEPMHLPIISHRSQLPPLVLQAADLFDSLALVGQGLPPDHLERYYYDSSIGRSPLLPEPLAGDLIDGEPFPWHLYLVAPYCPFTLLDERLWCVWLKEQRIRCLLDNGSQPILNPSRTDFIAAWERRRALSGEPAVWDGAKNYLLDHAACAETAHRMRLPVANPTSYLERILTHRPSASTVIALQQVYSLWAECYTRTAANPSRPGTLHAPWEACGLLPDAASASQSIFGELRSLTASAKPRVVLQWLDDKISDLRHDIDRMPEFLRDSWRGVLAHLVEQREVFEEHRASKRPKSKPNPDPAPLSEPVELVQRSIDIDVSAEVKRAALMPSDPLSPF